jgi:hypothetical protein
MLNASAAVPAPNSAANTWSRSSPSTRDRNVAALTLPTWRATLALVGTTGTAGVPPSAPGVIAGLAAGRDAC